MKNTTLIVTKTVRGEKIEHDYICNIDKANKLVKQFPSSYRFKEAKKEAPIKSKDEKHENKDK